MKDLTPGLELGARFVLIRRLGRGGTAEVWLADDRERGEQVALKVLDEQEGSHPFSFHGPSGTGSGLEKGCDPFVAPVPRLREHTVAVHGVEQAEGRTLIVME